MPQPLPLFYSRDCSPQADHVFQLLYQFWAERYCASGQQVDIPIDAPPQVWCCREFPDLPRRQRRDLLTEVMDHASLLYCEEEGHA